jgi:hypothetical protein
VRFTSHLFVLRSRSDADPRHSLGAEEKHCYVALSPAKEEKEAQAGGRGEDFRLPDGNVIRVSSGKGFLLGREAHADLSRPRPSISLRHLLVATSWPPSVASSLVACPFLRRRIRLLPLLFRSRLHSRHNRRLAACSTFPITFAPLSSPIPATSLVPNATAPPNCSSTPSSSA